LFTKTSAGFDNSDRIDRTKHVARNACKIYASQSLIPCNNAQIWISLRRPT